MNDGIKYLGHSAFYIKIDEYGILIDPWFWHNQNVDFDVKSENITHIFVTHGHSDHLGDSLAISKMTDAQIVTVFETAVHYQKMGLNIIGVGFGSAIDFPFGTAKFYPAIHTNSLPNGGYGGIASGIMFELNNGIKIFHAGDTALTKEFELIGQYDKPYYAMLPIGGYFTMGIKEAAIAAQMIDAKEIIPMHYNTFDVIKADPYDFQTEIESIGKICHIMNENDELEF